MLLTGILLGNVKTTANPQAEEMKIDVRRVMAGIEKAGLEAHEALYYKVIK